MGKDEGKRNIIVNSLEVALRDDSKRVRCNAAFSLGTIGDHRPRVLRSLLNEVSDMDPEVRASMVFAIMQIVVANDGRINREGTDMIISAIQPCLGDSDQFVRAHAVRCLGRFGKDRKDVLQALARLATDSEGNVRGEVARAIEQAGAAGREYAPILRRMLADDLDDTVRQKAQEALDKLFVAPAK
jgi:HEAT repeat protein